MNRPRLALAAVLALLPLLPGDDDPVAVGRERSFHELEYGRWLVERYGHVYLDDYVTEQLVLAEAEARELMPSDADVEAAWRHEYDIVIQQHFGGDVEQWREALRAKGEDPDAYAARRRTILFAELAHVALARADRVFGEDELRKRYADIYGDIGESVAFDVLFFSAYASVDPDAGRQDVQTLRMAAAARAREAADALRGGASLEQVAERSDPLAEQVQQSDLVQGRRVVQYRKRLLGNEVDRAVQSLDDPGDVAGPVQVWDGAYVLQLVHRKARTFAEARDEMDAILREAPPTAEELYNVRSRLLTDADMRILLR